MVSPAGEAHESYQEHESHKHTKKANLLGEMREEEEEFDLRQVNTEAKADTHTKAHQMAQLR